MIALMTAALAGGSEQLGSQFMVAVSTGDAASATALCTDEFRDRKTLGCAGLVKELQGARMEPARSVHAEQEALIEYWVHTERDGRWPITLQARLVDGSWKFVDGSDADGKKLETELSLAGKPDPGALALPEDVTNTLDALGDSGMPMPCTVDECKIIGRAVRGGGLALRPIEVRQKGANTIVVFLVEKRGRTVDDGYMVLKRKKGALWITALQDGRPPP